MREYIYKALALDEALKPTSQVVYGLIFNATVPNPQDRTPTYKTHVTAIDAWNGTEGMWGRWYIQAETICEYTGLNDHANNYIFEWDVLEIKDLITNAAERHVVIFHNGCYCAGNGVPLEKYIYSCCDVRVLGNIKTREGDIGDQG